MINYSTYMWKSPLDEKAQEQAYAKNQVTKVMSFDDFVKHISDHNGVFTRGTVKGVVSDTCSCLVEQLLNGYKVQFGELGIFSISITSEPAATLKEFTSDNIKAVNLLFTPGADFENLRSKAEFHLVTSRAVQAASLKAVKENMDTVDLAALKKGDSESPDEI
ncbi:HU family DNA-binding protein [Parabacteroides sp.]